MQKLIKIIAIFILFIGFSKKSYGQIQDDLIIGTWILEKREEDIDSEEILIGGEQKEEVYQLTFFENGKGFEYSSNSEFNYSLLENILLIGDRHYRIIELTEKQLIIQEPETLLSLSIETLIFSKIEN